VRVISRNPSSAKGKLQYPGLEFYALNDIERAVQGADAVVNLAGEPISTRWGL
jgi:NAD dependent epimerase/dehydratase family enzyme